MSATKTFKFAGSSIFNGVRTLRVANDEKRVNMLKYCGHTAIKLVALPRAMPKEAAYNWLVKNGYKGQVPSKALYA